MMNFQCLYKKLTKLILFTNQVIEGIRTGPGISILIDTHSTILAKVNKLKQKNLIFKTSPYFFVKRNVKLFLWKLQLFTKTKRRESTKPLTSDFILFDLIGH